MAIATRRWMSPQPASERQPANKSPKSPDQDEPFPQDDDRRGTKVDKSIPEGTRTPGSAEGERDPARQSD
jgi:hypothetical protein